MTAYEHLVTALHASHAGRGIDIQSATALGYVAGVFDATCRWVGGDWMVEVTPATTVMVSAIMCASISTEQVALLMAERLKLLDQ